VIDIKSDAALEAMREAGRVVAVALAAVRSEAAIGVSLANLDEVAHEVLRKAGARSPFLNYHPSFAPTPFPAVICASVNDVIVHGIPDGYRHPGARGRVRRPRRFRRARYWPPHARGPARAQRG